MEDCARADSPRRSGATGWQSVAGPAPFDTIMMMNMQLAAATLIVGASAGASKLVNPCLDATQPYAKQPWCNASLDINTRAADMVSRMDLKTEKIPNLNTGGAPIKSLGLPSYNWWEEASSGVSVNAPRGTTKFAYPITTGMSFNRTLWQLTGRQIGHEARALMNAGAAGSTYWAPVINLARERVLSCSLSLTFSFSACSTSKGILLRLRVCAYLCAF